MRPPSEVQEQSTTVSSNGNGSGYMSETEKYYYAIKVLPLLAVMLSLCTERALVERGYSDTKIPY